MKHFASRALVAGLVCAAVLGATNGAAADVDGAVLQADRSLLQALGNADKNTAASLLDADFTWTDPAGRTLTQLEVLTRLPAPAMGSESGAQVSSYGYGQVSVVRVDRGKQHALRVWVKRKDGWRALVYHEVTQATQAPEPGAPGSTDCDNPCRNLPYTPKSEAERGVIASWQELEKAVTAADSKAWAPHFLGEFVLISSNGTEPATKAIRIATLDRQKQTGTATAPSPLVSGHMLTFGDALVMLSQHQPRRGKPLRVSRVWVKQDGMWKMAVSFQTRIEAAP